MSTVDNLARTPLYDLHCELGAKMVPFAGYAMPVQYPAGVLKEHQHTRTQAGLFDVSHMGQVELHGNHAAEALESLIPVDVIDLPPFKQRYGLLTDNNGGIMDDLMITNASSHLFLIVNAANKQQDIAYLRTHLPQTVDIRPLAERALLALQGPSAAAVMLRLAPASGELIFMTAAPVTIGDIPVFITRSGYTGEDGFEISVAAEQAERLARLLLAQPEVAPIGLGARDSLRLEAGLCLHGHDISPDTTPIEAALKWAISPVRRSGKARAGGFPGADIILGQMEEGTARLRVGILPEGRAPVRENAELQDTQGKTIGHITSGSFGPTLGKPVAMGYVNSDYAAVGTELQAIVRGKALPAKVAKMPFITQRYYRGN